MNMKQPLLDVFPDERLQVRLRETNPLPKPSVVFVHPVSKTT
jgi:hypothetical protein